MIYVSSPSDIRFLRENEIFVFGSNLAGRHGKGAALLAKKKFGAIEGQGWRLQGQSYAIPTKDENLKTLPIDKIVMSVGVFIGWAASTPNKNFLVTEIGCGLAGYKPEDIAPLFRDALGTKNIFLPESFLKILNKLNI